VGIARTLASVADPQTTASLLPPLARLNCKRGLVIVPITGEMDVVRRVCDRLAVSMPPRVLDQVALARSTPTMLDAGHPDSKDDSCVRKLVVALTRPGEGLHREDAAARVVRVPKWPPCGHGPAFV
jgi:energy-coupling factor transporter ATP-binding protein EcfA2